MSEPLHYRARKWLVQKLTTARGADQLSRLSTVEPDVTLVLDACRADILNSITHWGIDTCRSPASGTGGWLIAAGQAGLFDEATVVAANPAYSGTNIVDQKQNAMWNVEWDDRLGTVLPEPVLGRVDEILTEDNNARVIAHLLQPHAPYVARLDQEWLNPLPDVDFWKEDPDDVVQEQIEMAHGRLNARRARRAYQLSIKSVWDVIVDYADDWISDGHSIVITADHGETFGRLRDYGFYAHPSNCHIKPLTNVPFVRLEPPTRPTRVAEGTEQKLQALGYRQSPVEKSRSSSEKRRR
jgi:hypothetical protein